MQEVWPTEKGGNSFTITAANWTRWNCTKVDQAHKDASSRSPRRCEGKASVQSPLCSTPKSEMPCIKRLNPERAWGCCRIKQKYKRCFNSPAPAESAGASSEELTSVVLWRAVDLSTVGEGWLVSLAGGPELKPKSGDGRLPNKDLLGLVNDPCQILTGSDGWIPEPNSVESREITKYWEADLWLRC